VSTKEYPIVVGKIQEHTTYVNDNKRCAGSGRLHTDNRHETCRDAVGTVVTCPVCARGVVVQSVSNAEAYAK